MGQDLTITQERAGAVDFTVPFMDSQLVIMAKEVNRKVIFLFKCVITVKIAKSLSTLLFHFRLIKKTANPYLYLLFQYSITIKRANENSTLLSNHEDN